MDNMSLSLSKPTIENNLTMGPLLVHKESEVKIWWYGWDRAYNLE